MKPQSAKAKGRELEKYLVQLMRDKGLDRRAAHTPGSGNGLDKGDIWNELGWCFEAKNTKKAPGKAEFEQVRREAMGYQKEVIVWHRPATSMDESVAIINILDFLDLLKIVKDKQTRIDEPTHAMRAKVAMVRRMLNGVKDFDGTRPLSRFTVLNLQRALQQLEKELP